jgi:hypothetical protein
MIALAEGMSFASEAQKGDHAMTHNHECYYRPACPRCFIRAAFQIILIRLKLNHNNPTHRGIPSPNRAQDSHRPR